MDVGIIGTGSMGGMLVRSLVRFGALRPGRIWAANRSRPKLEQLAEEVPGIHLATAAEAAAACPVLFICVKPGDMAAVLDEVGPHLTADHLLVVLSNMIEIAWVEERVPARVAKVIPSLAQEVGGGVLVIIYGQRITSLDRQRLERLLARLGRPLVVPEHLGRICADLCSCGPAFLAYVLEQMALAAVRAEPELPLATAEALVRETALATARLLQEGSMSCAEVMKRISVPGGITAEGLRVLAEEIPAAWSAVFATTRAAEDAKRAKVRL